MKIPFVSILLISIFTSIQCKKSDLDNQYAETILIDAENLAYTKARLEKKDPKFIHAFNHLIEDAEIALKEGLFSVSDKIKLPPSGNKNDYASYSRYWWPDPNKKDGLPYIRRDGVTNPNSQSWKESDRPRIEAFATNTETLGLAFYFTGQDKYAIKAAELIRTWFLNGETRMNPNLNHAQCRPGHNNGSKSGVLDGRLLIRALEGALLIKQSSALSNDELKQLKAWTSEYFTWLSTNKMALKEAASKNNHGSYYDLQAMYLALFLDNEKAALRIAESFTENRINAQIRPDGSMPEELARTRPLFYSIYNLHAMFLVAHLAEQVEVNLWKENDKNSRLKLALDYITPYIDSEKTFPYPTISPPNWKELFPILQMANHAYSEENYLILAEKLPSKQRSTERIILALPLMR